jgi:hypothetical protein
MRTLLSAALALAAFAVPLAGQGADLAQACRDPGLPAAAREVCVATAQAAESAQPQIGMLVAGGNPTPGVAGQGGLQIGAFPVSASARLGVAFVRIPDVLAEQGGAELRRVNRAVGIPAPALGASVSAGIFPGVALAPGIAGVGSVDLLASAAWLPFGLFDGLGLEHSGASVAYGAGVRLGLLRETFDMPAVAISTVYRRMGEARFGDVCRVNHQSVDGDCEGTLGEFAVDLGSWSHRLTAGKRLLGLGLVAGLGYDRHASDAEIVFRRHTSAFGEPRVQRGTARISDGRTSAFLNASYTFLLSSVVLEAGWMRGGAGIAEFTRTGDAFDPRGGTLFGSLGARVAF